MVGQFLAGFTRQKENLARFCGRKNQNRAEINKKVMFFIGLYVATRRNEDES